MYVAALMALASGALMQGFDRPAGLEHSMRSTVMATRGMVATSQPLAAQAGLHILRQGGNAFDAAVATAAVLNVVEPMSTGLGGDMFVIAWVAKDGKLVGLNGSGRSSRHATLERFRAKGYTKIPVHGADAVSIPGAADGWLTLHERYGKLPIAKVLAPAIEYAEGGFPVTEVIATYWRGVSSVTDPDFAKAFLVPDGDGFRSPRAGEIFRIPDLGRTLRAVAAGGRDAFYRGEIAARIADCLRERGSLIDREDLAAHRSEWVTPVSTTFHGYEVFELPPNGQGITVLEMLNILEGWDMKSLGHNSAAYIHRFIEAKKFAFADRDRFVADPSFRELPVGTLISKEYAAKVRGRIDPSKASPRAESVLHAGKDTIYLTTADSEGNVVSFINSIFHGFGSRVVVPGTGICLQNRGALFSLEADHFNRIEPSKRPFHTIIPGFVLRDGKPYMAFGVMGGNFQPQGHVQVLMNHILFGMSPQAMGEAARVAEDEGVVTVETGVGEDVVAALRAMGHEVRRGVGSYGGFQAILIDPETGAYHGGTESRKDGCAVGY